MPAPWSLRQQNAFARQGAALAAATQCGPTARDGNNIVLAGRRLRVAFTRFDQSRTMEEEGYRVEVDAIAHLPTCHDLTVALGDTLTYLPNGETYRITGIGAHPATAVQKLTLRRVNG